MVCFLWSTCWHSREHCPPLSFLDSRHQASGCKGLEEQEEKYNTVFPKSAHWNHSQKLLKRDQVHKKCSKQEHSWCLAMSLPGLNASVVSAMIYKHFFFLDSSLFSSFPLPSPPISSPLVPPFFFLLHFTSPPLFLIFSFSLFFFFIEKKVLVAKLYTISFNCMWPFFHSEISHLTGLTTKTPSLSI